MTQLGRAEALNDNAFIRLTIRHDRATVVVVGAGQFGSRFARLFTGADAAAATECAHDVAETLDTRVRAIVMDASGASSSWLPIVRLQNYAS